MVDDGQVVIGIVEYLIQLLCLFYIGDVGVDVCGVELGCYDFVVVVGIGGGGQGQMQGQVFVVGFGQQGFGYLWVIG